MKRKSAIHITVAVIVVLAVAGSIYLLTLPKVLGNINRSYTEQTTATSAVSFLGEAGDRIKFSLRSAVERGDLDVILYDSQGNKVFQLDTAKEAETFFSLRNADEYTLTAECRDFIGRYKIQAYRESGNKE